MRWLILLVACSVQADYTLNSLDLARVSRDLEILERRAKEQQRNPSIEKKRVDAFAQYSQRRDHDTEIAKQLQPVVLMGKLYTETPVEIDRIYRELIRTGNQAVLYRIEKQCKDCTGEGRVDCRKCYEIGHITHCPHNGKFCRKFYRACRSCSGRGTNGSRKKVRAEYGKELTDFMRYCAARTEKIEDLILTRKNEVLARRFEVHNSVKIEEVRTDVASTTSSSPSDVASTTSSSPSDIKDGLALAALGTVVVAVKVAEVLGEPPTETQRVSGYYRRNGTRVAPYDRVVQNPDYEAPGTIFLKWLGRKILGID